MENTILRYAAVVSLLMTAPARFAAQDSAPRPINYTSEGGMALPDYRKWVFIGSGVFDAAQAGQNPRFSNVFVEPAAYDQYVKTGVWPDRTVIFSEKRASTTTRPITTNGGWGQTGDALGAEMEVKDSSRGGWTYYEAARGEKVGKPLPKSAACYSCHAEHGAVDNTFVQFYPTLVDAAKRNGTYRETIK